MSVPKFLLKRIPKKQNIRRIRALIDDCSVHTVCESARCPNIGECFSKNTLTFMILGNICTRSCRFCAVPALPDRQAGGRQGMDKGIPLPPDPDEPEKIAKAVKKLGLNYAVITSVTRDDLPDGGAEQFAKVIQELKSSGTETRRYIDRNDPNGCSVRSPYRTLKIEVLIPDFQGKEQALKAVLDANPYVLNHNVETVPRLYQAIRPQADYNRSLALLKSAKKSGVYTKSGFMVGLGETREEVVSVLKDLRAVECGIVTIGQYLPPSKVHPMAERYVRPEEFEEYQVIGKDLGFLEVSSGPFVRSSYQASQLVRNGGGEAEHSNN